MKFSNLRAFEKHLEASAPDHFSSIYFILSKEPFEQKIACDRLTAALLSNEKTPTLSLQVFDAERHSIENILAELQSMVFFVSKQVIVIHNCDKLDKSATAKLEDYFNAPKHSSYLILTAANLNRTTSFYKRGEKAGVMLDIPEEKPWEKEKSLQDWILSEIHSRGKKISERTAQVLLKQIGLDQSLLSHEMDKLCCYVGERSEIALQDIHQISVNCSLENIWQLGEALFRKDAQTALRIGKALLNEGAALIALLKQIRSQFQTEFQICSILFQGGGTQEISQQFPYMKGHILDRHIKSAQGYGMGNFKKGLLMIDETELQAKNSSTDPEFLFELLIVKLTT